MGWRGFITSPWTLRVPQSLGRSLQWLYEWHKLYVLFTKTQGAAFPEVSAGWPPQRQ